MKTSEELEKAIIKHKVRRIPHHNCAICEASTAWVFAEGMGGLRVGFDSNCSCSSTWTPVQDRTMQEFTDWYNHLGWEQRQEVDYLLGL